MRFEKIALGLIAASLAGCFWATRAKRNAELALGNSSTERLALESEVRQAESKKTAAAQKLEEAKPLEKAAVSAPKTAVTPANARPIPTSQSELISSDPQLETLSLKRQRAMVGLEYGPFYRAAGLSPEQIRKFEENYHKHTEQTMDVAAVARTKGEAGKQTAATLQQAAKTAYEQAQTELLGVEGFQQAEEYIRTLVPRNVFVLGLAGAAAFEGIPLTARQGDQLWQAAINASFADAKAKGSELLELDWDALDTQAQRILSPAQFELFKNVSPPSGFESRATLRSKAIVRRAQAADAAAGISGTVAPR